MEGGDVEKLREECECEEGIEQRGRSHFDLAVKMLAVKLGGRRVASLSFGLTGDVAGDDEAARF